MLGHLLDLLTGGYSLSFSFPAAAYFLGGKSITFLGLKLQSFVLFFFFFLKIYLT
jgi:hypothetical protein